MGTFIHLFPVFLIEESATVSDREPDCCCFLLLGLSIATADKTCHASIYSVLK